MLAVLPGRWVAAGVSHHQPLPFELLVWSQAVAYQHLGVYVLGGL